MLFQSVDEVDQKKKSLKKKKPQTPCFLPAHRHRCSPKEREREEAATAATHPCFPCFRPSHRHSSPLSGQRPTLPHFRPESTAASNPSHPAASGPTQPQTRSSSPPLLQGNPFSTTAAAPRPLTLPLSSTAVASRTGDSPPHRRPCFPSSPLPLQGNSFSTRRRCFPTDRSHRPPPNRNPSRDPPPPWVAAAAAGVPQPLLPSSPLPLPRQLLPHRHRCFLAASITAARLPTATLAVRPSPGELYNLLFFSNRIINQSNVIFQSVDEVDSKKKKTFERSEANSPPRRRRSHSHPASCQPTRHRCSPVSDHCHCCSHCSPASSL
ncbi:hypothetical protein C4D60_Mb06t20400 [Musa balbisiana]|uniref:Uncharacterized protein n=1 Tax=Musa balbisiana TaxID=52838 RepID=A0A4S8IPI0_MUSBA|nr:hypothetical protein C4D60_Mb06t20400 [Musa balbisiana]